MDRNSKNNGFGLVHKERQKWSIKIGCCLMLIAIVLARHDEKSLHLYAALTSAALFGQLVRRVMLFVEEFFHVEARYKGSHLTALKACIGISDFTKPMALLVFGVTSCIACLKKPVDLTYYVALATFTAIVPYLFDLGIRCKLEIGHDNRIKYVADGQAWGYYVGYLKIIFANWESTISKMQGEHFQQKETKKDYRDIILENDRRLFILIPRDGSCFLQMKDLDPNIEFEIKTPELKVLRGGVMERKYFNTLYKIKREGENEEDVYALMEYATPLLNMYEMSKEAVKIDEFEFTESDREEQVNEFYNTLKRLLEEDKDCRGKYELVLMGSSHSYQGNHKFGDMIHNRIRGTAEVELE